MAEIEFERTSKEVEIEFKRSAKDVEIERSSSEVCATSQPKAQLRRLFPFEPILSVRNEKLLLV